MLKNKLGQYTIQGQLADLWSYNRSPSKEGKTAKYSHIAFFTHARTHKLQYFEYSLTIVAQVLVFEVKVGGIMEPQHLECLHRAPAANHS